MVDSHITPGCTIRRPHIRHKTTLTLLNGRHAATIRHTLLQMAADTIDEMPPLRYAVAYMMPLEAATPRCWCHYYYALLIPLIRYDIDDTLLIHYCLPPLMNRIFIEIPDTDIIATLRHTHYWDRLKGFIIVAVTPYCHYAIIIATPTLRQIAATLLYMSWHTLLYQYWHITLLSLRHWDKARHYIERSLPLRRHYAILRAWHARLTYHNIRRGHTYWHLDYTLRHWHWWDADRLPWHYYDTPLYWCHDEKAAITLTISFSIDIDDYAITLTYIIAGWLYY